MERAPRGGAVDGRAAAGRRRRGDAGEDGAVGQRAAAVVERARGRRRARERVAAAAAEVRVEGREERVERAQAREGDGVREPAPRATAGLGGTRPRFGALEPGRVDVAAADVAVARAALAAPVARARRDVGPKARAKRGRGRARGDERGGGGRAQVAQREGQRRVEPIAGREDDVDGRARGRGGRDAPPGRLGVPRRPLAEQEPRQRLRRNRAFGAAPTRVFERCRSDTSAALRELGESKRIVPKPAEDDFD